VVMAKSVGLLWPVPLAFVWVLVAAVVTIWAIPGLCPASRLRS
jgi:hypothetical protein